MERIFKVMGDPCLEGSQKLILIAIIMREKNGKSTMSYPELARYLDVTSVTITRYIKRMARKKIIAVDHKIGFSNEYTILWGKIEK